MVVKKLIVRNFGSVDNFEFYPSISNNTVKYEVGYAVAILINNQFALRYLKEIPIREETYLYMEMDGINNERYTAVLEGKGEVVYRKNTNVMTEKEIDNDPIITRPYREDNLTVFIESKKEDFFDYVKFMPFYIKKLLPYSNEFDSFFAVDKIEMREYYKDYLEFSYMEGFIPLNKISKYKFTRVNNAAFGELELRYCSFLVLNRFVSFFQSRNRRAETYTPLLVAGLLKEMKQSSRSDMLKYTDNTCRQAFFFEECK